MSNRCPSHKCPSHRCPSHRCPNHSEGFVQELLHEPQQGTAERARATRRPLVWEPISQALALQRLAWFTGEFSNEALREAHSEVLKEAFKEAHKGALKGTL